MCYTGNPLRLIQSMNGRMVLNRNTTFSQLHWELSSYPKLSELRSEFKWKVRKFDRNIPVHLWWRSTLTEQTGRTFMNWLAYCMNWLPYFSSVDSHRRVALWEGTTKWEGSFRSVDPVESENIVLFFS